ncbi:hypothetical protein [Aquabacter spiritensis]|uniref:Uncharacterized protein n=1 Tax=Aquabacter spiritensis TaxID=933073 RepID=A0A4V6NZH8_9HYPH|nr:hypothetical protein [Aquabacter spiritensis]TCT03478.1 hypothetical protein EDC64_10928 [Aquabacter spiritensis]
MKSVIYGALIALVGAVGLANAQSAKPAGAEEMKPANWLFVQVADSVTVDGNTLTLKGVAPQTLMFTDRPERMTGDAPTPAFVKFWTTGKSDFEKDPPNATLAVTVDGKPATAVVELTNPVLNGDSLTYTFKVLGGDPPKNGTNPSLFIDWWYGPGYGPGPYWGHGYCWRGPYGGLHCRPGW